MIDNNETLTKHWVHSHEEDRPGEQVFRPDSYAFPPSRGRNGLILASDGGYTERGPGPTDQPEERSGGAWELEGNKLTLRAPDGTTQVRTIISLEPDKLVLAS
jgi:Lipocalin-like domain